MNTFRFEKEEGVEDLTMPNFLHFLQLVRQWRIDTDDNITTVNPSTPIINVLPSVEEPKKQNEEKVDIVPEMQTTTYLNAFVSTIMK